MSSTDAGLPRFVGRADELRCVAEALGRSPAVVLVEGEAGIGKSRLVREALAAAGAEGARWLIAVCPPFREGLTLGPIVDAARQAVPSGAGLGELGLSALAGALRPLFPEWADCLPAAPEPLADAGAARHRLMRALAELLDRLGIATLVVEDIHWADEATLEFLLFLASRRPLPFSLVLTYRRDEVAADSLLLRLSARVATGTEVSYARISLGGLAAVDATELVASMLGDGQVPAALTSFLHECTGGVPLVLEECVRLLLDRADLVRHDGAWVQRTLTEIVVPPTIRDAITERAARLGAGAQRVLLAAAVLAGPADERALGLVSGLGEGGQAEAAMAEALGSGLLVADRADQGRVAFRHTLAARAVYDQSPAPERRAAHRRAAALLEAVRPRPVGRLAHHYRQAGEIARWREYAGQAADIALASGDHHRALSLLHELITEPELPAGAVAPLVQKMPFHAFIDYAKRADVVAALRAVLETDGLSASDRAQVRGQLGRVLFSLGDFTAAAAEWELAIPDLGTGTFDDAWAMIMLGWPWAGPGPAWPAATHRRWLERGQRLAEGLLLAPHQQVTLLVNRVSVLLGLGDEAGWALAEELGEDESTPQLAHERARGELNLGDAALRWGRYGEARRRLASAADIATRHGYQVIREAALATLLRLDYLTGAWPGLAERARELASAAEEPVCRLEAQLVGAQVSVATGGSDSQDSGPEAEELLRTVQEEGERRGVIALWLESAAARARLRLSAGEAEEALAVTEDGMRLVTDKGIWLWASPIAPVRVAALAMAGRTTEAERLVSAFEDGLRGRPMPAPATALEECRAALAAGRRAARGTRHGGRRGYGERLSPREMEVVRLMLDGMTNRQIAEKLSKSPETVAAQLKSAMRKYGVTSRTALAVSLTQEGVQ